jgi:ribonuclease Z
MPKIYVPKSCEKQIWDYIHYTFAMTKNTPNPKIHNKCNIIGCMIGERQHMIIKKMPYIVDIYKAYHTVPCVSYGFSEVRTRLLPEYKGYEQAAIEQLKHDGVTITTTVEIPQFFFGGDTDERIFTNPIEKFPTIIIECSFLYPEHMENAKKDKHMHWNNLMPYIATHPDNTFILMHFSARYTDEEINAFFKDKKLDNMIIWI